MSVVAGDGAAAVDAAQAERPEVEFEGALCVQEVAEQRVRSRMPADAFVACPAQVSAPAWQLEIVRQVLIGLTQLCVALKGECTRQTCPKMEATQEWSFFCASHSPPKECCAIEYQAHTIDATVALVTSGQVFPSRLTVSRAATKHFASIARRLYRNFAHAFFHHRQVFDRFEMDTMWCARFIAFVKHFDLMAATHLIIPEAEVLKITSA